jgi:3-phenylpropionate/trans-cinnamate dioxygenase ferredoxin reductase component
VSDGVLIAGGGLAAQRCCETLRSQGFEGPIRIICEEERRPYDRPPLSKGVLSGDEDPESLAFRETDWYVEGEVELLLGERAVALDPGRRSVTLDSGAAVGYESLLIATGSRPRVLPGTEDLVATHTLRTVEDAVRLRGALRSAGRLIVVGAGFVGLEVAATARALGLDVTVLEAAPAPMLRVLGPRLAGWFVDMHRAEGVEVMLSAHVARLGEGADGTAWVQLTDGRRLECDALVVGIGIEPATEWLEGSGLDPEGVPIDANGRTDVPGVYAAGDSARQLNTVTGAHERSEHWEAASRQGRQVARAILGLEPMAVALPSFWTDQYGLRVRLIGDAREADELEIDGEPEGRDFTALMHRDGSPVAAMEVGRPRALPALRKRIEAARSDGERSEDELRTASG